MRLALWASGAGLVLWLVLWATWAPAADWPSPHKARETHRRSAERPPVALHRPAAAAAWCTSKP